MLLRYFNPIGAHKSGRIGEDPQGIPNNLLPFVAQVRQWLLSSPWPACTFLCSCSPVPCPTAPPEQVAVGRREQVSVFGNDYNTPDGTGRPTALTQATARVLFSFSSRFSNAFFLPSGVRDYIHVVDLALGHVAAINRLKEKCGCVVYNLGTGKGASVLDMIKAFSKACGKEIKYQVAPRREGDIASCYAGASARTATAEKRPRLAGADRWTRRGRPHCPQRVPPFPPLSLPDPARAKAELKWEAKYSVEEACEDAWRWQSNNPNGFKTA